MNIRVLLVDDHKIMRKGLKAILALEHTIEVVAEAANGREAIRKADELLPDVVVMDLTMPEMNGIEAIRQIVAAHPDVRTLVLSMVLDRACVMETFKAGATGYLLKDCAVEELVGAIHTVASGEPYLCPQITSLVIRDYTKGADANSSDSCVQLSKREREVLQLIANGNSTKEIAFTFGVSIKTVAVQRMSVMKKLNLFNVADLTKYAVREGLTSIE
ncbi:response regulator transcription factor [Geotalea uraniireducens]|nr:response regulator transcription factor [Geotalea uraniireducens]